MNITVLRSDKIYDKMLHAKEKEEVFREELLKSFEYKWKCIGMDLDRVVGMAALNGWYTPSQITMEREPKVIAIHNEGFWKACESSIRNALEGFEAHGVSLSVNDYIFTVVLSDPDQPMTQLSGDYCGDGGIPGYILGTIVPNETSMRMMPVALAHETNHNVRWQYMQWSPMISLADMLVSEGLAENFAAMMYGEDNVGKWVKETSKDTLEHVIKPMIVEHLQESDFNRLSSYLYGDDIMKLRGQQPIGMPFCGGYACGYAMIQYYLKKTGMSIYEATILPTDKIMKELEDFWK